MGLEIKDEFYWDITELFLPSIQSYAKSIRPKYRVKNISRESLSLNRSSSLMDERAEVKGIPEMGIKYVIQYSGDTSDFHIQVYLSIFEKYKCTFMYTWSERLNLFFPNKVFRDRAKTQLDESVCKEGVPEEYKRTTLYKTYRKFFKENPDSVIKALNLNVPHCQTRFLAARETLGIG